MRHVPAALAFAIAAVFSIGTAVAQDDISKVNSSVHVDAGRKAGNVETVNGSVTIESDASAEAVETVNGGVRVGTGAQARSIETVNGGVTLSERAIVHESVEAVNGSISLAKGVAIGGDVGNVNGAIELDDADVAGRVSTVSGDITVGADSRIGGGIKVEKPTGGFFSWGSNNNQKLPRIVIDAGAEVQGDLVFEREVELFVHENAKVGTITGAQAKRFNGPAPTR